MSEVRDPFTPGIVSNTERIVATKIFPNWRERICGGETVEGTDLCGYVGNIWHCKCEERGKAMPSKNMRLRMLLASAVRFENLHLDMTLKSWEAFSPKFHLANHGDFGPPFKQLTGDGLRDRFKKMMKEVINKHDLPEGVESSSKGFETHQEVTHYDKIMMKMHTEMQEQLLQKEAEKKKKVEKADALIHFKNTPGLLCQPVLTPQTESSNSTSSNEGEDEVLLPRTIQPSNRKRMAAIAFANSEHESLKELMSYFDQDRDQYRKQREEIEATDRQILKAQIEQSNNLIYMMKKQEEKSDALIFALTAIAKKLCFCEFESNSNIQHQ